MTRRKPSKPSPVALVAINEAIKPEDRRMPEPAPSSLGTAVARAIAAYCELAVYAPMYGAILLARQIPQAHR